MHILTFYTSYMLIFLPYFILSADAFQWICCNRYHFFTNRPYAIFSINKKSRYISTYRAFLCCLLFTFFSQAEISTSSDKEIFIKSSCTCYIAIKEETLLKKQLQQANKRCMLIHLHRRMRKHIKHSPQVYSKHCP